MIYWLFSNFSETVALDNICGDTDDGLIDTDDLMANIAVSIILIAILY